MKRIWKRRSQKSNKDLRERSSIIRIETLECWVNLMGRTVLKRKIQYNKDWNTQVILDRKTTIKLKRKIQYNKDWNSVDQSSDKTLYCNLRERSSIIRIETFRDSDPYAIVALDLRERSSIIRIETDNRMNTSVKSYLNLRERSSIIRIETNCFKAIVSLGWYLRERSSIIRIETQGCLVRLFLQSQLKRKIQYNKDWNVALLKAADIVFPDLRERSSIIRIETRLNLKVSLSNHST